MSGKKVEFHKCSLKNGFVLYLLPTDKFKRVTVDFFLPKALSDHTTETALLTQVLLRGTENFPTYEHIQRELEYYYGASLTTSVLKLGELQVFHLSLKYPNEAYLPKQGENLTEPLLRLCAEVLEKPRQQKGAFLEEIVSSEKQQLAYQIEGLMNDKASYAYQRFLENLCCDEDFRIYPYGDLKSLEKITSQGLYEFYLSFRESLPRLVFVLGKVEPGIWEKVMETSFSFPRRPLEEVRYPLPQIKTPKEVKRVEETLPGLSQAHLYVGFRTPIHVYQGDLYGMVGANALYGVFPHSKLFWNLREKQGLAYSTYSHYIRPQGIVYAYAGLHPENVERAVQIMQEQWQAIQEGDISDFELESTKNGLLHSFQSLADSPSQWVQFALRRVLAGHGTDLEEVLEEIRSLSKERIQRAAQTLQLDTVYVLKGGEK